HRLVRGPIPGRSLNHSRGGSRARASHFFIGLLAPSPYSATYFHGAVAFARRQTVKYGSFSGRSGDGAFGRIHPIVTPRSPLDATMTRSGAHDTGLVPSGTPCATICPIVSDPVTNPGSSGRPRLIASALPYCAKALAIPIFCASLENARSARSRLSFISA